MPLNYGDLAMIDQEFTAGPPPGDLQMQARDVNYVPPTPQIQLKSAGGGSIAGGGGMPYGTDATNLASLFDSLNQISAIRERVGGGTGGGTQKFEGNMDMNKLIALNPYMEKNVTSFANGGEMEMDNQYMYGGKRPEYNQGGMYEQAANQAIAQNQLSGLVANAMNKRAMMMAKGGKFKPHMMYNPKTGEGYMANKLQDHLDMKEKGYDHRKRNPENYPKAAYGMKMRKRYTNGGRF